MNADERTTKAHLRTLRHIHAELEAAPDKETAIQCDLAFHRAIAEASGNRIFRLVLDSLAELGTASRQRTIGRIGKARAIEHHARIIATIEQRDPAAGQAAMHAHILAAGEDMDLASLKSVKK